jgi:hypothetical protein
MYKGNISNNFPPILGFTEDLFIKDYYSLNFISGLKNIIRPKILEVRKKIVEKLAKEHKVSIYILTFKKMNNMIFDKWFIQKVIYCPQNKLLDVVEDYDAIKVFTTKEVFDKLEYKHRNISICRYFDEESIMG